jgi:hypothetical protein
MQCDQKELPTLSYGFASGLDLEIADEVNKVLKKKNETHTPKK